MKPICYLVSQFIVTLLLTCSTPVVAQNAWNGRLYLNGGDYWRARLPVVVTNHTNTDVEGRRIALAIRRNTATGVLVGTPAKAVRVCSERGVELRYRLETSQGRAVQTGVIPDESYLTIPVTCPHGGTSGYYVYFDNPNAQSVPDPLIGHHRLWNGDVEHGDGDVPEGWTLDPPDDTHRIIWANDAAQSGKRALKTVVAEGAKPTWIGARQQPIHVLGSSGYRIQAWVKARNVQGYTGWFLHIGNARQSMLEAPLLRAGEGTFDWKKVELDFKTPPEADRLCVGTVLRGTGTAWFDNVRLELLDRTPIPVRVEPVQRMKLRTIGHEWPTAWPSGTTRRALVRVFNFSDQPHSKALVSVDFTILNARMKGKLAPDRIQVMLGNDRVPFAIAGSALLLRIAVPARSVANIQVNLDGPAATTRTAARHGRLSRRTIADMSLLSNGSFEKGSVAPDHWNATPTSGQPDRATLDLVRPGKPGAGNRSLRMRVPRQAEKGWRGWRQEVAVKPGKTYLLSGWARCKDVNDCNVQFHVHLLNASGQLVAEQPYRSLPQSIEGTTDWTLLSGMLTMPTDAAAFEVHLTIEGHGTVWYDNIRLTEVKTACIARFEGLPMAKPGIAVWPVHSVIKVFPDDPVPPSIDEARISCAANEWETLQLAMRSAEPVDDVQIVADPPHGPSGHRLDRVQVNVVGLVPIDHATNYYRSDQPPWQRMVPDQPGRCDGWPGLWPDPLLPTTHLSLNANETRAIWITFKVPRNAPPGDYRGSIRLISNHHVLSEVPYQLHIWNFTLPESSQLGAIYDVRFGPGGRDQWGRSLESWYPEIVRFMAEHRLCADAIKPTPMIRYEQGKVVTDFREYDKAAHWYFDELNLPFPYTPWTFYLFGWGHPPKVFAGQRPYDGEPPYKDVDRSRLRPEYKKAYQACLKAYWDHMKDKGWDKKIILYISDEPYDRHEHIRKQMRALCDMIHEVDPAIPIYSSTWKHVPDWDGYLNVWGIGHDGRVPTETMKKLQATGARLWFTTDGQMCTDTPYCAVERLLPHYCVKYDVQAYEFWGVAWTTLNPFRYGWHSYINQSGEPGQHHWVRYPNGDGFLIYPGPAIGYPGLVSSIRLEQAREGVEDFDYLTLLRDRIEAAKRRGHATVEAERSLADAATLVTIPNDGGRYSSRILPDPNRLYDVRRRIAKAIESLQPAR